MLGAITTNAYDVDGGPLLSIIPKDRSSLKAFIIEVFNKVHKSHKKNLPTYTEVPTLSSLKLRG